MKNFIVSLVVALNFLALGSFAADAEKKGGEGEYKFEVCKIPLVRVITLPAFAKMIPGVEAAFTEAEHHFIRITHQGEVTSFNFDPKDPNGFMGGDATINTRDFEAIKCERVAGINLAPDLVKSILDSIANDNKYSFSNAGGINCQVASKLAVDMITGEGNYPFAVQDINQLIARGLANVADGCKQQ